MWLKGITTLEQFKDIIKTCKFWAEQWAINVLEVILNIKMIILSKENYEVGDVGNVLSCGDFIDKKIEQEGTFKPTNYIITSYTGNHYMLITYRGKRLFNFQNLPYALKELIISKCMEKDTGIYNMIPQFKKLKESMNEGEEGSKLPEEKQEEKNRKNRRKNRKNRRKNGYKTKKNLEFQ